MNKKMVPGTPNLLRMVNRNTILFHLEQMQVTSRVELSNITGLSQPTVSAVIRELVDEGWISEVGGGASQGGKPPQLITLNPDARQIVAVQINRYQVRVRLTNLIGNVVSERQYRPHGLSAASIMKEIYYCIKELLEKTDSGESVMGVGVSVPGVVDEAGVVSNAPELGWDAEPVKEFLSKYLEIPVIVENDVKLAAVGEGWRRNIFAGTMVYVHLDYGIGAGILIDGKLYKGAHFSAGEISNLVVDSHSSVWSGEDSDVKSVSVGAFEKSFGLGSLLKPATKNSPEGTSLYFDHSGGSHGSERVLGGDKTDYVLRHLACGVSNLIAILDPAIIVFGGKMTFIIPDFVDKMRTKLTQCALVVPEIQSTLLGRDASLNGAVRSVMNAHKSQVTWTSV